VPRSNADLPTTDEGIYLANLEGQIKELERLVKERPEITSNVQRLAAAIHTRGRFRNDPKEMASAIAILSDCIKKDQGNAICFLMRAEQEQSLHKFKEARSDLQRVRLIYDDSGAASGISLTRVTDLETELDWNDGLYEKAIPAIRKARKERPSNATWLRDAQLRNDLGASQDEIDQAFEAAEDEISDTAPLQVAHLNLQRGIQRVGRGDLEKACEFFREAERRMPTYVAAIEHLAETLHMMGGHDDEAITLYEKVVTLSSDPEFAHALGDLYVAHDRKKEGEELQAKAKTGYEALLKEFPEAMYWHASEFYMSTGDKKRALGLLEKNLTLRPNSTSYVALAKAQLANDQPKEAKSSIDKALAMPLKSATLFFTASKIEKQSGDTAAAETHLTQAKALNPRIEKDD
jgi:tetratricopeptide (TPR) repeat protein